MFEVILLESLQYPWQFTEAVAECIFTWFKVIDWIYVFLRNTLPIYTHAVQSGLVIDTGFLMSEVSATVFGAFSKIGAKTSQIGSAWIDYEIYQHLCEDNEMNMNDPVVK